MDDSRSATWVNALIGAVATVVFSFTMVSPVLGGAVAGYLERTDGAKVGAIAGVFAILPLFLLLVPVFAFVGLVGFPVSLVFVLVPFVVVVIATYTVALSALGGFIGEYLYQEY